MLYYCLKVCWINVFMAGELFDNDSCPVANKQFSTLATTLSYFKEELFYSLVGYLWPYTVTIHPLLQYVETRWEADWGMKFHPNKCN